MNNFEKYLIERSSIMDYYLDNPDKIKSFNFDLSKKADNNIGINFFKNKLDSTPEKIQLDEKITKLYLELKDITEIINKELKDNSIDRRLWAEGVIEYFNYKKENEKLSPTYIKNKPKFELYNKLKNIQSNYVNAYLTKLSLQHGITVDTLLDTLKEISQYRSMSGQKLNTNALPAIKELTVTSAPGKIYRGWFLDGKSLNKIKDIENLKVGDTVKFNFGKPSSWSTMLDTAKAFSSSQDSVKDSENGYSMIFSYEPSKDELVADLRNLGISKLTGFYNQQEIILETGAKNYIIEFIEKGDNYKSPARKAKTSNGGSSSLAQKDIIKIILMSPAGSAPKGYLEELEIAEKIAGLTVAETSKQFNLFTNVMKDYLDEVKNVNARLFTCLLNTFEIILEKQLSNSKYEMYIAKKFTKDFGDIKFDNYLDIKIYFNVEITNFDKLFRKPKMKIQSIKSIESKEDKNIKEINKEVVVDYLSKRYSHLFDIS